MAALSLVIAIAEGMIMVYLGRDLPVTWQAFLKTTLLDAGLLALVLSPFIYLLFLRPHQRLQEQYADLVASAPDPIVRLDAETRIVFANARALHAFGCTVAEAAGRPFGDLLAPEALPHAADILAKLRRGVAIRDMELPLRTREGRTVLFEISLIPSGAEGPSQGGVAILRDIQRRKEAERRLEGRLELERVVSRVSSRFIGSAQIEGPIEESLGDVGRLSGAGRAYLCLLQPGGATTRQFFEWHPEGLVLPAAAAAEFSLARLPWLRDQFQGHGVVRVNDVPGLPPEAANEKAELARRGVRAELVLPLSIFGELAGFLGLELFGAGEPWREEDVALLRVFSEIVGRALEQQRAETQIRASEERFRTLFERAHDLIQCVAPDGSFLFVNPAWLQTTGYAAAEIRSLTICELLDPAAREPWRAQLEKALAGDDQEFIRATLRAKDGHAVEVEGSLTALRKGGETTAVFAILRDVTERERMQESVFRAQQDWKETFDNLTDMVTIHDADFHIIHANKAAEKILGLSRSGCPSGRCFEYYHGTRCPPSGCPSCQTLRTAEPSLQELFEPHLGRHLEIRAIPRVDREGRLIGLIHVVRDITERKQLEQQLRHSQKMEAIGQLAGAVAHDFNNLLSVIIMYGDLLQEKDALSPIQQSFVNQILKSSRRAATLTRSLLAFSRKQSFKLEPLDMNEAIRGLAKLLQRVLGEEISLGVATAERPLVVQADAGQLEQVVMNLCTNARDAMPQGGTLGIDVESFEMDEAFVRAHSFGRLGSYALLTVRDTGCGMDEATRTRIFEPFFTTKVVGRGTGLGLAIVYGIVKQHAGFIDVASQVGAGTTFRVYLPLVGGEATADREQALAPPRGGRESILVAEDEEEVRKITRIVLEGRGYHVLEAVDGEDAVRRFHELNGGVQLLLTDVVMPLKNGREAYEEMRREAPSLKVLYRSGYTADFLEQKGIESGAVNFLYKPSTPSELLRKVREVLDA